MGSPLKHRWSTANNYLAGITLDRWFELLADNPVSPAYWHRAAFVTLAAAFNSLAARQERCFDDAIRATRIEHPPLFILGHWRSGTTHLHNLLARDRRFAFPNTYQVINPLTFLSTEERNSRRFARLVPEKRPMDDVAMGFGEPQEDEFAPCLTTLRSLYLGMSFPRSMDRYERYLTFGEAFPSEIAEWKESLLWFCKKLVLRQGNRPLVLKSPPHTARIRLLLELFPTARFVHIHRHPHDVFLSNRHYWNTAVWYTYMQRPERSVIDDQIIRRYRRLHDAFHEQRPLIPASRFHELPFADLEADPVAALRRIYESLGLPDFGEFLPDLQAYLTRLGNYRKNRFDSPEPPVARRLAAEWRREFEQWNYDPDRTIRHS